MIREEIVTHTVQPALNKPKGKTLPRYLHKISVHILEVQLA